MSEEIIDPKVQQNFTVIERIGKYVFKHVRCKIRLLGAHTV
jgi:hypothetical protein